MPNAAVDALGWPASHSALPDVKSGRICGTVGWYDEQTGFGRRDDRGADVFFGASAVKRAGLCIAKGRRLEFEVVGLNGKVEADDLKMA